MNKRLPPLIWTLLGGLFASKAAMFMTMPFLALYLWKEYHLHSVLIGLIVGCSPIGILLGGLFGGQLSDLFGRTRITLIAIGLCVLSFIGFFLVSFSNTVLLSCLITALLSFLIGVSNSAQTAITQALLSDWSHPEQRAKVFQLRYTAFNLAAVAGPIIGVALGMASSKIIFLFSASIYFAYGFLLWWLLRHPGSIAASDKPQRVTFKQTIRVLINDRRLQTIVFAMFTFCVCYAQIESTLSQVLIRQFPSNGAKLFGFLLALNGVTVVLMQIPIYRIVQRMSFFNIVSTGILIFASGLIVLAYAGDKIALYFAGMLIASIGEVFLFPNWNVYVDHIASKELRGTYFGAANLSHAGMGLGPIVGGWFLHQWGGPAMFIAMAALAVLTISFYRKNKTRLFQMTPIEE